MNNIGVSQPKAGLEVVDSWSDMTLECSVVVVVYRHFAIPVNDVDVFQIYALSVNGSTNSSKPWTSSLLLFWLQEDVIKLYVAT